VFWPTTYRHVTPQFMWAHTLDIRPRLSVPNFMHVQVMHAYMRSSVHIVSRQARNVLDTGFSAYYRETTAAYRETTRHWV
jgi:hypothetical protein